MPELNFNALIPQQDVFQGLMRGQERQNALAQQAQARQLGDIQLQNALREQQAAAAESEAYKGASDLEDVRKRLMAQGLGKQSLAVQKQMQEQKTTQLTQAKTVHDLLKAATNQIVSNPAMAKQSLINFSRRTGEDVSDDLRQIESFNGDLGKISNWAAGIAIEADKMLPKFQHFDTGGGVQTGTTDYTGKFTPGQMLGKTATPGELMSNQATIRGQNLIDARAKERLAAESATGVLTPESLDVAANVYLQTGQLPQGNGKSASGLRTQVMNRATELSTGKPAADVAGGIIEAKQDVAGRGKAVKDFSTGRQGQQVNAFNTAIDHLSTMDKLSDALQNGDVKAFNTLGNTIARQTGNPAPTNFDAAKQIVTAEVIKAVVASGGGVTERQEAERNFANANSPSQLKGLINTYQDLLGGQLKSLNLQYENTTGRKDFDKKLTPAAQSVVSRIRGDAGGALSSAEQAELDQLRNRFKK